VDGKWEKMERMNENVEWRSRMREVEMRVEEVLEKMEEQGTWQEIRMRRRHSGQKQAKKCHGDLRMVRLRESLL